MHSIIRFCRMFVLPLLIYLIISTLLFGRFIFPHINSYYFGTTSDPIAGIYAIDWWPYALKHGLSLLYDPYIWAPAGQDMTIFKGVPALSILFAPVTYFFNAVVSYNLIMVYLSAISALTAFILCRYISKSFWAALIGGFVFGFSSYEIAQIMAHISCASIFLIPLFILFILLYLDKKIHYLLFITFFSVLLILQFLLTIEILATFSLILFISLGLAIVLLKQNRQALISLFFCLLGSYCVLTFFASPYLYHFFISHNSSIKHNINENALDVLNFFIPTSVTWIGGHTLERIGLRFPANLFESGGYIGIPLLIVIVLFFKKNYKNQHIQLLYSILLITLIFALGPYLHKGDVIIFQHLPWLLFSYIPVINEAVPARFIMYSFLAISIILSLWLAQKPSKNYRYILAGFVIISLLPNPHPGYIYYSPMHSKAAWSTKINVPLFIKDHSIQKWVKPHRNILVLPYRDQGMCDAMIWQIENHMYFNLAGGCTGSTPNSFQGAINTLLSNDYIHYPLFPHTSVSLKWSKQWKEFIQTKHIRVVIVSKIFWQRYKPLLELLNADIKRANSYIVLIIK